ncbi:hypothetical protein ACWCPI_12785 [Streptomyces sp. NPDC001920]
MDQQWPEGPMADPDAARDRYNADLRASRSAIRELFRVELPIAHVGAALAALVSVVVGVLWSPAAGALIAGGFSALFIVAMAVALLSGRRGWGAVRAAYKFTFGWANWITP